MNLDGYAKYISMGSWSLFRVSDQLVFNFDFELEGEISTRQGVLGSSDNNGKPFSCVMNFDEDSDNYPTIEIYIYQQIVGKPIKTYEIRELISSEIPYETDKLVLIGDKSEKLNFSHIK